MLHGLSLVRQHSRSSHRSPRFCFRIIRRRQLLTLAIETSCDDTCVAILDYDSNDKQRQLSHGNSGIGIHHLARQPSAKLLFDGKVTARNTGWGGIHPIEALDSHKQHLAKLVDKAIAALPVTSEPGSRGSSNRWFQSRDGNWRRCPDFVSVTRGPGMRSNLSCGLEMAKGLAVAWQVPLLGVHHMQAHALTPRLSHALNSVDSNINRQPDFPFLTLLVSGGHTMLLHSTGLTEHKILATTADIAIGDALDKCGRLLLPESVKSQATDTAFGKYLSQYAFSDQSTFTSWPVPCRRHDEINKPPNKFGWHMQVPLSDTRDMTFSFASIATRTEGILRERKIALGHDLSNEEHLLLAQTALGTAFEHLSSRTILALQRLRDQDNSIETLVVSGGVAANDFLRHHLRAMLDARDFQNVDLVFPPVTYCTDNAAMIAWTGMEMYEAGYTSDLGVGALRKWSMDADSDDGGILGIDGWKLRD